MSGEHPLKTWLVGGAVRDRLLGLREHERDWLVTGVDGAELERRGYRRVGRDFPVYLHPQTGEEYALPRHARDREEAAPASVEDDLKRRDLTVNAMGIGPDGTLLDPLGGVRDLEVRLLRHTPSFAEDPIRILRLARFTARFAGLGFRIAPETRELVRTMVREGALRDSVPERVLAEIRKALEGERPRLFFEALRELHALAAVLPELDQLFGVPQRADFHPEVDTGEHSLLVLERACELSPLPGLRFAALLHDVGKGLTPRSEWPRHIAHESRGVPLIEAIAIRLRLPRPWRDLARLACRNHILAHRARELRPTTLLKLLQSLDAFRRAERFEQFLLVCEADWRGRLGHHDAPYPQREFLQGLREAAMQVDPAAIASNSRGGQNVAERIRRARLHAISVFRRGWKSATVNGC